MRKLLKASIKSHRSNLYDLHVRNIISQICPNNGDIYHFKSRFDEALNKLPRHSVGPPSSFYKAILNEQLNFCEVWHLDINGEADRLIAVVIREEVSEEEYRKIVPQFLDN